MAYSLDNVMIKVNTIIGIYISTEKQKQLKAATNLMVQPYQLFNQ